MYYVHTKELLVDDPFPMYENQSELIEADGEAEELFLNRTVDDQYPSQTFIAIDWVSGDDIELDIADYIGQDTYDMYESIFYNMDESETFSYTKADSFLQACIMYSRKQNRKKRGRR